MLRTLSRIKDAGLGSRSPVLRFLMLYPGAAIFLVVLGFNLLGDGLRDVLDPTTYRH